MLAHNPAAERGRGIPTLAPGGGTCLADVEKRRQRDPERFAKDCAGFVVDPPRIHAGPSGLSGIDWESTWCDGVVVLGEYANHSRL